MRMGYTYLVHHGVKGQKWGVRKYQNQDGSLTPQGQQHYYGKGGLYTDAPDKKQTKLQKYAKNARFVSEGLKINQRENEEKRSSTKNPIKKLAYTLEASHYKGLAKQFDKDRLRYEKKLAKHQEKKRKKEVQRLIDKDVDSRKNKYNSELKALKSNRKNGYMSKSEYDAKAKALTDKFMDDIDKIYEKYDN